MCGFKRTLLITAFFIGMATAPAIAQTEQPAAPPSAAQPAAPAAQVGTVTGTVSNASASAFTLNYNGGAVKVLMDAAPAAEKAALRDGQRVTVTGAVDQAQRAFVAQNVVPADPNTPTSGVAQNSAQSSAPSETAVAREDSDAARMAAHESAASSAEDEAEMAPSEDVMTAETDAAAPANDANAPAAAAPPMQMAAADAERLSLAPDANLPREIIAEISDGSYTTADLNRAALQAMRGAMTGAG